jgi:hypothetical protein
MNMQSMSRRSFLAGSALALGGWVLLPATGRAKDNADPNRFILMADTHVCADRNARERGCNPDETIQQAVKDILELTPRPAGVIVAGDCVYLHGLKPDYEALKEFLEPLRGAGIPLLLAMGNHDNRRGFASVFSDAAILQGTELADRKAAVIETPHADWYLLDSCTATHYTPGLFGGEQLSWLAGRLDKSPSKPALLVAHHYPKVTDEDNGLEDTEAFLKVVGPRRQVKCYFFGHSHRWALKQREDGLHLVNLPANAWLFNETFPRGFVDARLEEKGCALTLHCLDRGDKRHGEKRALDWRSA